MTRYRVDLPVRWRGKMRYRGEIIEGGERGAHLDGAVRRGRLTPIVEVPEPAKAPVPPATLAEPAAPTEPEVVKKPRGRPRKQPEASTPEE